MYTLAMFAKLLLIIGGIAWGVYGTMKINIVRRILPYENAQRIIYILVGLSALMLLFNKNFYLPFLDKTVMPKAFLTNDKKPLNATVSVEVRVPPNSRVIYWGSEPSNKVEPVRVAYGEFENSGITTADTSGKAHLVLRKPSSYNVNKGLFRRKLKPHVHYRYTLDNGMLSEVHTKRVHTENDSFTVENTTSESSQNRVCNCVGAHVNLHEPTCHKFVEHMNIYQD